MKLYATRTLFLCLWLSFSANLFCQEEASIAPELTLTAASSPPKKNSTPITTTRFHKRFPQLFTGLAIEIATSTYPIDKANPAFRQFGNVLYEKLPEGGYSYLIMANFSTTEAALEFVREVVKPKAEKAQLIQFNEGNRKTIRE